MKKVRDNKIKGNLTVTSSNFWNNKDFDPFLAKNHSKLTIEDKNLIQ